MGEKACATLMLEFKFAAARCRCAAVTLESILQGTMKYGKGITTKDKIRIRQSVQEKLKREESEFRKVRLVAKKAMPDAKLPRTWKKVKS